MSRPINMQLPSPARSLKMRAPIDSNNFDFIKLYKILEILESACFGATMDLAGRLAMGHPSTAMAAPLSRPAGDGANRGRELSWSGVAPAARPPGSDVS
jgi:hypothetical protein